eukprot:m.98550 g.98550  ORF g.98550 m.98550 type:complete len:485 (-) comp8696_c0_seq7:76-1530(-)
MLFTRIRASPRRPWTCARRSALLSRQALMGCSTSHAAHIRRLLAISLVFTHYLSGPILLTVMIISDLVQQLADKYQLSLRSSFNITRGFFISMQLDKDNAGVELPPMFEQVTRTKRTLSMTTADLRQMNDRINESLQDIFLLAGQAINDLLASLREDIGYLYKFTEAIAMIDLLWNSAHATVVSLVDCVRPEFSDTTAIKQGVHPVLQALEHSAKIVPNDVYIHSGANCIIITGPNMSGKSVYLRQVAQLQIMAQVGFFVPAQYACFRIVDHIFSRMGSDDRIETNSSTFMLECQEMSFILQNITDRSLVIIDELGRGTSPDEGVGLSYAMCETILATKAFCLFATHFRELTTLDTYPNVENFHFQVQRTLEHDGGHEHYKLVHTHQLVKGPIKDRHYGLHLAAATSLAPDLIQEAQNIADKIEQYWENQHSTSLQATAQERAVMKLATRLVQVAHNIRLDDDGLRAYLRNLQLQHREAMTAPS